ncbi:MAG: hypothetical protein PUP93_13575 [Rhizonema sp. NSF051]|nr:hypothetical protein [Rhizonema sp. NSF051]
MRKPIKDGKICRCPPSSFGCAKDAVKGRDKFSSPFLPFFLRRGGMAGFFEELKKSSDLRLVGADRVVFWYNHIKEVRLIPSREIIVKLS